MYTHIQSPSGDYINSQKVVKLDNDLIINSPSEVADLPQVWLLANNAKRHLAARMTTSFVRK